MHGGKQAKLLGKWFEDFGKKCRNAIETKSKTQNHFPKVFEDFGKKMSRRNRKNKSKTQNHFPKVHEAFEKNRRNAIGKTKKTKPRLA